MRQTSLKIFTLRYMLIIFSIVISLTVVSFLSIKDLLDASYREKQQDSLQLKAHSISVQIYFYQQIVNKISARSEVADLVQFTSPNEAQVWATHMQQLIPDSIALAIFNDEGEILGNKKAFRIGTLCYEDLKKHLNNIPYKKPPMHNDVPAFAHFDLLGTINSDDERVGVLFASFSLSILQNLLNKLTEHGQYLRLYTGNDILIVENNQFITDSKFNNNISHSTHIPIKNSDWYLQADIEKNKLTDILIYIALANAILFALISAMIFIFSSRLVKTFSYDLKTIHTLLIKLKKGDYKSENFQAKLSDTEEVLTDIKNLAEDISEYQQQLLTFSQCDDLTGLLNRRGFFTESARCIDLKKRSIDSALILLDIDHFKQINDNLGHAAGDKILEILSSCIKSSTRSVDVISRLGGDEFAIILVQCNVTNAVDWYENLLSKFIQQQQNELTFSDKVKYCTLSAGCSTINSEDTDISMTVTRADKALYVAKNSGKANIKSTS